MMKKLRLILFTVLIMIFLFSCAGTTQSSQANNSAGTSEKVHSEDTQNQKSNRLSWLDNFQMRFHQVWQIPKDVPKNPHLQATYSIKISSSGEIISKKLIISSGNKSFDQSVELALEKIKLTPPPDGREEWIFTFVPPYGN